MDERSQGANLVEAETQGEYSQVSLSSLAADIFPESQKGRIILAVAMVVLALISFFAIGAWASSPDTYAGTIASLDDKRDTVMSLIAGSTGASAAITVLPGDVGTPIASKLLDVGADFAIVVGAIYLEKYLLTILGFAAFKLLIPVACVMVAIATLLRGRGQRYRAMFVEGAVRLAVFGIALAAVVPVSVAVSDAIDGMYQESAEATIAAAEEMSAASESAEDSDSDEKEGLGVIELVQSIPGTVADAAEGATTQAQETLNSFIETLAVMIVTSCVIPILVLVFFLWLAKTVLGLNVSVPVQAFTPRTLRGMRF